ncbi:MAG TPA: zinc-binding dehydrogenase, partial [Acidimicrobiia bacterium]
GRFTNEDPETHRANFARIIEWAELGRLSPIIQKRYSLDNAAAALQWVADRKAVGRVVVNP